MTVKLYLRSKLKKMPSWRKIKRIREVVKEEGDPCAEVVVVVVEVAVQGTKPAAQQTPQRVVTKLQLTIKPQKTQLLKKKMKANLTLAHASSR